MNRQAKYKNGVLTGRGIEWTDFTSNISRGCFHGCEWLMPNGEWANCYAEDTAEGIAQAAYPEGFEHAYWNPKEVDTWNALKPGERVFVGSMADNFGHWVTDEQVNFMLDACRKYPNNVFQFLTKNFGRVHNFEIPTNVWVGASSPPDKMWGKLLSVDQRSRWLQHVIKELAKVHQQGVTTWMSAEPLTVDLAVYLWELPEKPIDWVIIGAASDGKRLIPPAQNLVENLVNYADKNSVKVFFKGNLKSLPWAAAHWREEFPA